MPHRPLRRITGHLRTNLIAYVAVFLALGGGYAIAANRSTTIHGCVVKKTGELLIRARCSHGQTKLTFDQTGPRGPKGQTGATGAAAPAAWALVGTTGVVDATATSGITSTHVSTGTYQLTVTAPACSGKQSDPVVTVADSNPPAGQAAGSFPVAWVTLATNGSFTVYTGVVVGGSFTPADRTFSVQDVCGM